MNQVKCFTPFRWLLAIALPFLSCMPAGASSLHSMHCQELLANGGFEAGPVAWAQASAGGYELVSQFNPRTGQWGAYLAGANDADDSLSQPIFLPADAISLTLRLWWSLESEEPPVPADTLTASLLRPDGVPLAELWQVDNTAAPGLWDEAIVDLAPYAGQSVILRFWARSNSFDLTDFYLDDISIAGCIQPAAPRYTLLPLIIRQR
jgi:hypothetical protein